MKLHILFALGAGVFALATQQGLELRLSRISNHTQQQEDSGVLQTFLTRLLYWFTSDFQVGDSKNLTLLIDTGSTPFLLNPGIYKPSKHMTKYPGNPNGGGVFEGVNHQGFGFESLNVTLVRDQVTAGGLTVPHQSIGLIKNWSYIDTKPLPYALPADGLVGFERVNPKNRSWFQNLYFVKKISQYRFGLAYGTDGKGLAIIGKVATRLFHDELVTVPLVSPHNYSYDNYGDVYLNDRLFAADQLFTMDDGTNNIQPAISTAEKFFKQLGWQSYEKTVGPIPFGRPGRLAKVLFGYFPCNKPPTLGFAFPPKSQLKEGQNQTIFNLHPSVWGAYDYGNNNCTSIVGGANGIGGVQWLIGQPFFQGRYVDFNSGEGLMGYANLKNPTDPTA